ncbi:MAG: thymidylate kinase, partial [Cellulosilyticum sp.]|nr:thymidylate kinase [Cellulosilyticum sp.]
MKNRLFLIEGLPCSGKSTTSKYIAKLLKKQQNNVVWIDEGTGNHPADYEFQSYITEEIYRTFN